MTERIALAEVAEINPRVRRSMRDRDASAMVPFIAMAAVSETGAVSYDERRPLGGLLQGYTAFERGDVLLAKITPCFENGKATHVTDLPADVGFGSTEFHVLRPRATIDGRYLFHAIWNPALRRAGERQMSGTAGQKRLPTDFLRAYKIPVPPLAEQRRIAAILDHADAIRRKVREALRLLDAFLQSAFRDIFGDLARNAMGWEMVAFPELLQQPLRNGLSPATGGTVIAPVLTLSAISGPRFEPAAVKIASFAHSAAPGQHADERDFLICRGNGNLNLVGRGHFPHGLPDHTLFPDTMIAARINRSRAEPRFFEALWMTDAVRRPLERGARTTSGIHKINQQVLLSLTVPLPPIDVQRRFARIAQVASGMRARLFAGAAEDLMASLTQRAFLEPV